MKELQPQNFGTWPFGRQLCWPQHVSLRTQAGADELLSFWLMSFLSGLLHGWQEPQPRWVALWGFLYYRSYMVKWALKGEWRRKAQRRPPFQRMVFSFISQPPVARLPVLSRRWGDRGPRAPAWASILPTGNGVTGFAEGSTDPGVPKTFGYVADIPDVLLFSSFACRQRISKVSVHVSDFILF